MDITKEIEKAKKYIQLAKYNAELFSKDKHTKVGAIILASDFSQILATGINGFPRTMNDDIDSRWERPTKYKYVCHAEANAIANAAMTGTAIKNSVMSVTKFPCSSCAKLIIQAGIKKIYTIKPNYDSEMWGEDSKISEEMFNEVGVNIIHIDIN